MEAADLKSIGLPLFDDVYVSKLREFGKTLAEVKSDNAVDRCIEEIDKIVFANIAKMVNQDAGLVSKKVRELHRDLAQKRRK